MASQNSSSTVEARLAAVEKLAQRAYDRGEVENVFSKYMHLHNVFQDEQIKSLWVKRGTPGVHAQYTNVGVYTDYDSIMAYHSGRPSPPGKLILHETTTPLIEVAGDGETAKGFWLMAGVESGLADPKNVGTMPEFLYEPEDKNVDGKRVWTHWVWCHYALDFLKQDGQWKIWHFRCLEVTRAPFSENWITFAKKNQLAFDKDLAYFGNDGKAVFMPTPDAKPEKSDAWWSLGMSVNTFRIVLFQSNPHTFNKWLYSLICFGGPFISGFTLFFISTPARGPVYGATTTWCWIRESWASIRLFTSYLFVWICIATSIVLNTAVGFRLFRARNEARDILNSRIQTTVTDHQTITETNTDNDVRASEHPSVTATLNTQKSASNATAVEPIAPNQKQQSSSPTPNSTKSKFWLKDPIKRAYLFTTFMFTLSVLVTWVPASITRIHSLLNRDVPYSYQVAIAAVMPLQGLWNALIFFTTSRGVIKDVIRKKWGRWVFKPIKNNTEIVRRESAPRVRIAFSSPINSAQVCIASKCIYVHESIDCEFLKELITAVEQHSLGDGLDSNADLGPVQSYLQFARVRDLLAGLQANDLKIATGLTEASNAGKGYFITLTVVGNPLMIPESSLRSLLAPFSRC
ncbi:hypothetical protein FVER53590_03474 [Fusarium verticillioides]|nr:hypothetical protein FVER53590_03474 [Fusarium verticillioides]